MVKNCNICSVEKNLTDFYKSKSSKDGLESFCKVCKNEKSKKIYLKNKEHRLLQSKLYYYSNQERQREVKNNWKKNNPELNRAINNTWEKNKRKEDKFWACRKALRTRFLAALSGRTKSKSTLNLVGLSSWDEFKSYLETLWIKDMCWDNYGQGEGYWVIDHIIPLSSASNLEELEKLQHYTNLQPLWWRDNLIKGAKVYA
jgi:5-methylcytosine-specific restriction endonuclease McrA